MTESVFDFNAELDKLIKSNDCHDENEDQECLISREKLNETAIKLECGHSFNYEPLYNEIIKQKVLGHRVTEITKLCNHQLKCPYCRNIQNKVLPYAPFLNLKRITGVNSPAKWQMLNDRCCYSNNNKRSKYFNTPCNEPCWGKYCTKHAKLKSIIKAESKLLDEKKNVVVAESTTTTIVCSCILKSGPRKGQECGGKMFLHNKCKRHYNLENK